METKKGVQAKRLVFGRVVLDTPKRRARRDPPLVAH